MSATISRDIVGESDNILVLVVVAIGLLIAVIIAFALYVLKTFIRPLERLTEATHAISPDSDTPIVQGRDEIATLVAAFEAMATRVD